MCVFIVCMYVCVYVCYNNLIIAGRTSISMLRAEILWDIYSFIHSP